MRIGPKSMQKDNVGGFLQHGDEQRGFVQRAKKITWVFANSACNEDMSNDHAKR